MAATVIGVALLGAYLFVSDNQREIAENRRRIVELQAAFAGIQATPQQVDPLRWTDPETGCVYYYMRGVAGGIRGFAVRYRRDGTPDCPTEDQI
jgi:hypothetical protein